MPPRTPNSPPEGGFSEPEDKEQPQTPEQLQARIRQLEAALRKSDAAKEIAEDEANRLQQQAQASLLTSNVTERFAGKSDDGEQDMWWYRIDLAPCGGLDIKINGLAYIHGETYKLTTDQLRSIKEIVARTWNHENAINGTNENPYKKAQNRLLGGAHAPQWAYR
jgi:hypothetical protein